MRLVFFILLLLPISVLGQRYIDKNRDYVKRELEKYVAVNKAVKPVLKEKGSTITLTVNDPASQSAVFSYHFDETTGLCNYEKTVSTCDSCYNKYLQNLLDLKSYEWKKINESQYVSKFSDYLLIELQTEGNEQSFTLLKTQWSKELYELMQKN